MRILLQNVIEWEVVFFVYFIRNLVLLKSLQSLVLFNYFLEKIDD